MATTMSRCLLGNSYKQIYRGASFYSLVRNNKLCSFMLHFFQIQQNLLHKGGSLAMAEGSEVILNFVIRNPRLNIRDRHLVTDVTGVE